MKHLLLISVLFITLVGCKKKDTPAPAAPPPATQATPTALTPLEQSLCGYWISDSTNTYNNGVRIATYPHNDSTNCFLQILSTEKTVGDPELWKKGTQALHCNPSDLIWRITNGKLNLGGGNYTILTVNGNCLILQLGSISAGGGVAEKFYFHK